MALRVAASSLGLQARTCIRAAPAPALRRVYFHASRTSAQTSTDITDAYKAPVFQTPAADQVHGSYHWDFERLLSVSLVPLFAVTAIKGAHPITDGLLGTLIPIHAHLGFDAMITDYLHVRKAGVWGNRAAVWTLRGATLATLVGCYQFNTNDIGLTELVVKAWTA
ncbi:membrane anchor subunit of succinate dehydrogenase, Sdh4 [Actinomortierella wolfii]|nr:membrane anchor subunit of succinate dehydrogenase, Sdh4 [Actinomortierella wolfii]